MAARRVVNEDLVVADDEYTGDDNVSSGSPLIQTSTEDSLQIDIRDESRNKGSFGISVFNLMNAVLGSGILGLSSAMAGSGIILFSILLVIVALLATYSLHLLLKSCDVTRVKSYEDIGSHAMGLPGKLLATAAILLQNIGAMSSYLFIVKTELPDVIRTLTDASSEAKYWYLDGDYLVLLMMIVIIAPLAFLPNIGFLGYTSGFSIFCMVFFTIVIVIRKFSFPCPIPATEWENITEPEMLPLILQNVTDLTTTMTSLTTQITSTVPMNSTGDECKPKLFSLSLETAYAVPTMAFSFVCHTAVLPIYTELKSPSKARMQNIVYVSIAICFTMYMVSALFGYLTFYDNVESELLEGYMSYNPHDTLMLVVRLAVLLSVTLTVPLLHFPARKALTLLIAPNKSFSWVRHIILTCCLLTLITVLAIFVPVIKDIFGIAGATSSTSLVFILPALFYLCIGKEALRSREKIMALSLLVIGVVVLILSLSLIIYEMVDSDQK